MTSTVHPPVVPAVATYRLQFTPAFRFADALRALPYLQELGVSHLYASPITRARRGSTHGYDVCDPHEVNPQLGTREELLELLAAVRAAGMGWIQDIVPNHLAASVENPYWRDTLQHGRASRWARVFDIDWEHPELDGRIQLPILGEPYGDCLDQGKLSVVPGDRGPELANGDLRLPLAPASVAALLAAVPACLHLAATLAAAARIADPDQRDRDLAAAWAMLAEPEVRAAYAATCAALRGEELDRLVQAQHWRLVWWRTGREVVGYRRFFAIDDLVAVRIEDEAAFALMHGLAFDLVDRGLIDGLRVDHVDGLRDPDAYLEALHRRVPGTVILVEKILAGEELLPARWPISGTTGYEFLAGVGAACCHPDADALFDGFHRRFTGADGEGERLKVALREDVDRLGLGGDADRVVRLIHAAHPAEPAVRDMGPRALRAAVAALTARFPVYRTYGHASERPLLDAVRDRALADRPALAPAIAAVHTVLGRGLAAEAPAALREALLRFQQFSGPVMAKGCEDTFFYAFTRWIGRNEVGGDPLLPVGSPSAFIRYAAERGAAWPLGLNATATHDTKRGEDTRARLAALTWSPDRWEKFAGEWLRTAPGAPHADDQYLALQTLVATWPAVGLVDRAHLDRVQACVKKSLREAGVRSSWNCPDEHCEARVAVWLEEVCDPSRSAGFLRSMNTLVAHILPGADAVSLAMTVLKCALPGVPDVYQGCEWQDLSLVDPDNRRPVDFAAHAAALRSLGPVVPGLGDPRRKQAVLARCLALRRADPAFWLEAGTEPVAVEGDGTGLFAFARARDGRTILVLADARGTERTASLTLPALPGECRWRDALTGTEHPAGRQAVAGLLAGLPAAVLVPAAGP